MLVRVRAGAPPPPPPPPPPPNEPPFTALDTIFASGSWLNTTLPNNTLVHSDSAAGVAEIVRQVGISATFNIDTWTAPLNVVPPDQPLTPIKLNHTGDSALTAVLATGVPMPAGWQPTNDADAQGYFIQPDYVCPGLTSVTGRLYELQSVRTNTGPDAAQYPFTATYGGRMVGTHQNGVGHMQSWQFSGFRWQTPGDPDSTYMDKLWLAFATGVPAVGLNIRNEELERGLIRHPIGIEFMGAAIADQVGQVWPAQRHDGASRIHLPQGTRGRLPAGYVVDTTKPRVVQLITAAWRDYGFMHCDTAGSVAIRMEPGAYAYLEGHTRLELMRMLPWPDLQVMAVGSDTNANLTG